MTKQQNLYITAIIVSQFKDATLTPPCYTRQASTDWPCYEATRYEMCSNVQILLVVAQTFKRHRDS